MNYEYWNKYYSNNPEKKTKIRQIAGLEKKHTEIYKKVDRYDIYFLIGALGIVSACIVGSGLAATLGLATFVAGRIGAGSNLNELSEVRINLFEKRRDVYGAISDIRDFPLVSDSELRKSF